MKYDSGIKAYHADIVEAFKASFFSTSEIKRVKLLVKKGTPSELKEYLKSRHGNSHHGGTISCGDIWLFDCSGSGLKFTFKNSLNDNGDKDITFSWSQVATFIRNNADNFYENESAGIETLDLDVMTFNLLKREGINTVEELESKHEYLKGKLTPKLYGSIFKDEPTHEAEPSLPDAVEDKPAVTFDYSDIETATAAALKSCEDVIKKETAGYFTLIGAKFKEAQELLASYANGTFEKWYTALGFKRQTVYNLIGRYEFLCSPTIGGREEEFEALPLTLSYEISKQSAPSEFVEKVLDGEITSAAEYKKLKAELEEAKEKTAFWVKSHNDISAENQQLRGDRNTALDRADDAERELEKARRQIKEFENRPIEVAVKTDTKALEERDRTIVELRSEIDSLNETIERKSDNIVKTWAVKLTLDEFTELIEIVEASGKFDITHAVKSAQMLRI